MMPMKWLKKLRAAVDRPYKLLAMVSMVVAGALLLDWWRDTELFHNLFFPKLTTTPEVQAWSARSYAAFFAAGLPAAFLLWHWRDRNMRDQIEEQRKQVLNARKDTNLKEFQEVQMRAAGALDEKLPSEAREQLQIAALHQLRGFLKGDYGPEFKRPAFELLLAGHAAAVHRIGVPEVQAQVPGKSLGEIAKAVEVLRAKLSPIDLARMAIIRDEFEHVFTHAYPLRHRRFDLLDLSRKRFPAKLDMGNSHFFGVNLREARLERANLYLAHLEGAGLSEADMQGLQCFMAHLQGANLSETHLEGADFLGAHLQGAKLLGAHLEGALLADMKIDGNTDFSYCTINNAIILEWNWSDLTDDERQAHRQTWLDRGAINVDDLPPVKPEAS